jgi:hypothetical protein
VVAVILRDYRWFSFRTPRWFITDEVTEPDISRPFVWLETLAGEVTYIYGYYIYAIEENRFELWWSYGDKSISISLPGPGTVIYANSTPINLESPNTEGSFGLNILDTPSSGSVYQAGILATGCRWVQI